MKFGSLPLFLFSILLAAVVHGPHADADSGLPFAYDPIERPASLHACADTIREKLKDQDALNIGVALGYSDMTDEGFDLVTDIFTFNSLGLILTGKCTYAGQGFCGFTLVETDHNDVSRFVRDIIFADGQWIKVNVYVTNAAYSIGNSENKTKYKDLQEQKTALAQNFYAWSLRNLDVVFYEGHSRDGGGPDFAPPYPAASGKVNYPWYRKNKPGLKFLLKSLAAASAKPMTIGLFSCASRLHFLKTVKSHAPETKMIMTPKVIQAEKTKGALMKSLESLLNFECDSDLKARLKDTTFLVD